MSATQRKEEQREDKTIEIKKSIIVDASSEVVFKAITDPQELTHWFPDQVILEPKVGGKIRFSFYKQGNREHRSFDFFPEGTIIEFIPNKRISYTWQEPNTVDFPRTVVTWELEEIENNKTRVKLLHKGFQAGKLFEHDEGWSYFLNQLQKYCENREY
jgi:uncharacterized protein YndB with AHSA1/START domain